MDTGKKTTTERHNDWIGSKLKTGSKICEVHNRAGIFKRTVTLLSPVTIDVTLSLAYNLALRVRELETELAKIPGAEKRDENETPLH